LKESSLTVSTANALISRQEGILDTMPVYKALSDSSDEESLDAEMDSKRWEIDELRTTKNIELDTDKVLEGQNR
jgi:hypothetical protein